MDEMERDVLFVCEDGCNDVFRERRGKRYYVRQPVNAACVRWSTASKWEQGFEADTPVGPGQIMKVVDESGNQLFVEIMSASAMPPERIAMKHGAFFREGIQRFAREISDPRRLKSWDSWRRWLLADKEQCGNADYEDNWLFGHNETVKARVVSRKVVLGKHIICEAEYLRHRICGKTWANYHLIAEDQTVEICGFDY